MEVIYLNERHTSPTPCAATIGFFDGVHQGHLFLITEVQRNARQAGIPAAVVTFDRHPREVIHTGDEPQMLSTLQERLDKLAATGIDYCFVVPFNAETAAMSAHDFMRKILLEQFHVRLLVIGYDNRFGHNRTEGFDDYVRFGKEMGMTVIGCDAFVQDGVNISSSVVRRHLQKGEVEAAALCLGYPYALSGKVESGEQEGRKMGFPTANLHIESQRKLIPQKGVYAVWVAIEGENELRRGMMNIGQRPTFGTKPVTIEVHILDFEGNLYGKQLTVTFVRRLREEQPFDSPEQLVAQLRKDREIVRNMDFETII